jgi:hypothetical protein
MSIMNIMKAKGIVTGKVAAEKQAVLAVNKLRSACVRVDHVHTLLLNSPERRASRFGGAQNKSSRFKRSQGVLKDPAGAFGLEMAPGAAADGLQISAFTGSLARDLGNTGGKDGRTPAQPDEIMIAVETSDNVSQVLAISVLVEYGARDIERADGFWQDRIERADGLWQDRKLSGLDPVPLSSPIASSVGDEENPQAALLRPKVNPKHH